MCHYLGPSPLLIVAILTPHRHALELFREYEIKAAGIIARHGGVIERTVVEAASETEKPVREAHLVSFPDREAFERYRADAELASLADLRMASIARTELLFGGEGPDYMALFAAREPG